MATKALKAHIVAVENAIPEARAAMGITGDVRALATVLANACLQAEDGHTTRYVVGTRTAAGTAMIYGPFATRAAAEKAIGSGDLLGEQAGVWPLLPTPRRGQGPQQFTIPTE